MRIEIDLRAGRSIVPALFRISSVAVRDRPANIIGDTPRLAASGCCVGQTNGTFLALFRSIPLREKGDGTSLKDFFGSAGALRDIALPGRRLPGSTTTASRAAGVAGQPACDAPRVSRLIFLASDHLWTSVGPS